MTENASQPDQRDAAFDRLRGADPAAGVEPDISTLDAAVRARLAGPADEVAAARARHGHRTWMTVAAVAAGALVFGTGGFALGHAGRAAVAGSAAGGVITLGQASAGSRSGLAAPQAASAAADATVGRVAPWYGSRTVFTASGLSDVAGSAKAWTFDASGVFNAQTANRLARVLGVQGAASLVDGAWIVGPNDGSGSTLQLQPDALASVNYSDPRLDPYSCQTAVPPTVVPQTVPGGSKGSGTGASGAAAGGAAAGGTAAGGAAADVAPAPAASCPASAIGPAPQGDAAIARVRGLIGSLGVDATAFEYQAQDSGTPQSSYVTAFEVIDGQRTGVTWSGGLTGDRVQSLSGSLAPVRSLGDYDVISAQDAVGRLTDPRFAAGYAQPLMYAGQKGVTPGVASSGVASPDVASSGVTSSASTPAPLATRAPVAKPGSAIAWPLTEVVLTSARLGLTIYVQPDGATVLLPAYALSSASAGAGAGAQVWSVVAVSDAHLDFAPVK